MRNQFVEAALVLRMIGRVFVALGLYMAAQELHSYGLGIATVAWFVYLIGTLIKENIESGAMSAGKKLAKTRG